MTIIMINNYNECLGSWAPLGRGRPMLHYAMLYYNMIYYTIIYYDILHYTIL